MFAKTSSMNISTQKLFLKVKISITSKLVYSTIRNVIHIILLFLKNAAP